MCARLWVYCPLHQVIAEYMEDTCDLHDFSVVSESFESVPEALNPTNLPQPTVPWSTFFLHLLKGSGYNQGSWPGVLKKNYSDIC